jgi:peptidoglycan-associated lipoprotein
MKKIHIYSFLICITILSACSSSKKAEKSFANGEYNVAIETYKKALKPNDPESNFNLAEAYRLSNRISESAPYYSASLKSGIENEYVHIYYAKALKANENFSEATKVLDNYIAKGEDEDIVALARREVENIEKITAVKTKENYYRVKNLAAINTPSAEYSPIYNQGYLYFTSNRHGGKVFKGTGTPFTDIYKVKSKGANVDLNTLEPITDLINDPDVNEGSITMSKNGSSIIFAKGNNGKFSGTNEVNLYFTRQRNGKWSQPRYININGKDTWDSAPALSPDGTTLYFSSNREGGFGGIDIYSAKVNRRGRWVDVRNLGDKINTPGNDMFPSIGDDGNLYFSSDGHSGLGGLDVFVSKRDKGVIYVENLGVPVNSNKDDFGFFLFNPSRGFFTSNRKGGAGDDDIYTFVNDDPNLKIVNYFLSGTTLTPNPESEEEMIPLSNTKVLLLDENEEVIDEVFTKVNGKYRFRVYSEENYNIRAEKENYFTTRRPFSTIGKSIDRAKLEKMVTNVEFTMDLPLDQIVIEKSIVMDNIYYDLNKAEIRLDAEEELDNLVTLMGDNPDITIELSSHTDVRADHDYNMDLSQRRAKSAVDYIISRGIDQNRMIPKGYGETNLIILNAKTEEEHQVNRRTEFKVLKYKKPVEQVEIPEDFDETDRFFSEGDSDGN